MQLVQSPWIPTHVCDGRSAALPGAIHKALVHPSHAPGSRYRHRMAKSTAVMLTVGDREVRVSSPERVVYEATDWAPEVTKLQVCEYFIGVAPAFMRASGDRP